MATAEALYRVQRRLGGRRADPFREKDSVRGGYSLDLLRECENLWNSLAPFRASRRRCRRFTLEPEGQWGDVVRRRGRDITEARLLAEQGRPALQNNLIRQCTKTLVRLFRTNKTQATCISNDRDEQKLSEMMSQAVEVVSDLNRTFELDAAAMLEMMVGGGCCSRVGYRYLPSLQRVEACCENVPMPRLFFNPVADIRLWDLSVIGQLHDYTWGQVKTLFCQTSADLDKIAAMFARYRQSDYFTGGQNLQSGDEDSLSFHTPPRPDLYRVVEVWRLETREFLYAHDTLRGEETWYEGDLAAAERLLAAENEARALQALQAGAGPMPVEYRRKLRQVWYYRFLTPLGEVIREGRSPYWHEQHPYVLKFLSLFDGTPHSFVEDIIPQQKMLNRYISSWDFIVNTSAKNTLAIAEGSIPPGHSIEEYAREYRRVGGIIYYRPLPGGGGVPQEISSSSRVVGMSEMITLMQGMIEHISGVHPALQGQQAPGGTSGRLYEQQATNASLQHVDLIDTFNDYRLERDRKLMKTIQQYWDPEKFVRLCGKEYTGESLYYDSRRVKESELDLKLTESPTSSVYRARLEEPLMQLFASGQLPLELYLKNTTLPFADKMLQQIEALRQGQAQQAAALGEQVAAEAAARYGQPDTGAVGMLRRGIAA